MLPARCSLGHSASPTPTFARNWGFQPDNISAQSLRAGSAMALLLGNIDADTIRLIGRWFGDKILH